MTLLFSQILPFYRRLDTREVPTSLVATWLKKKACYENWMVARSLTQQPYQK